MRGFLIFYFLSHNLSDPQVGNLEAASITTFYSLS